MLKSVLIGVLMTGTIRVAAQDTLIVQGVSPDLYLTHTVKKGETLYSLGRTYGLSPKDIAARNNMQMDQGLGLGAQVAIPLNKNNFVQAKNAGAGVRPVYHRVLEKETLYRIHVKYAKVPLDNVREWNHINGDGLQKDAYLIVGYVKGSGNSAVSSATVAVNTPAPQPAAPETKPAPRAEPPAQETKPAPRAETPAQETSVTRPQSAASTGSSQSAEDEYKPVASTQSAAPETKPAEKEAPVPTSLGRTPVVPDGSFEQIYRQQTNNGRDVVGEKGPGSWFKSNAIIGSGKYYALHNTAPRGTILKVTNPLTGRSIYAKVLDAIPQLKANANLIIKLSDAAQDALGITQPRFYCELAYDER